MKKEKYPLIYAFDEKHGIWYVQADNKEEEDRLFLFLIESRLKEGYYSYSSSIEKEEIHKIIKEKDYKRASTFLWERRKHEYEDFHCINVYKITDLI